MKTGGRNISVLLVDDEPLIGLDLSDTLVGAGYEVIGPASTIATALSLLDRQTPRYAVIDVKVRDGLCLDLARQLRRQNVPFIIHTGYPRDGSDPMEFSEAPRLIKPASPSDLLQALMDLSAAPVRDGMRPDGPDRMAPAPAPMSGST